MEDNYIICYSSASLPVESFTHIMTVFIEAQMQSANPKF